MPTCGKCLNYKGKASEVLRHQGGCIEDKRWERVLELRADGRENSAKKLTKELLGVKPKKKMTPEKRAAMKEYQRTHKEEIKQRRLQKKQELRAQLALANAARIRRK